MPPNSSSPLDGSSLRTLKAIVDAYWSAAQIHRYSETANTGAMTKARKLAIMATWRRRSRAKATGARTAADLGSDRGSGRGVVFKTETLSNFSTVLTLRAPDQDAASR